MKDHGRNMNSVANWFIKWKEPIRLADMVPLTGSLVQCIVVHSLPDMIVVSFETQDQKVFQGALLCMPNR